MNNSVCGSDVASDHRHVIHSEYHLVSHTIRYDTIEEFNVDSKAEYTA